VIPRLRIAFTKLGTLFERMKPKMKSGLLLARRSAVLAKSVAELRKPLRCSVSFQPAFCWTFATALA
jgi:hypothetical protein